MFSVTDQNCIYLGRCFIRATPVLFRLREHVEGADNNPLLIFPEGTCVNNHYSVMFKKVSFSDLVLQSSHCLNNP